VQPRHFIGQSNRTGKSSGGSAEVDEYFLDEASDNGGAADATRGMTQREQAEVLEKFNSGEVNTLVATSIAEGTKASCIVMPVGNVCYVYLYICCHQRVWISQK
jgi:ERCC4-related helicase